MDVCSTFYYGAIGISKTRLQQLQTRICNNQTHQAPRRRAKPCSTRVLQAGFFLKDYARNHGQAVPNAPEIHLQRGLTKTNVHDEYKKQASALSFGQEPVKYSHFVKIWNEKFPCVKTLESTDFARCNFCDNCQAQMQAEHPKEVHDLVDDLYKQHLEQQKDARNLFYWHNYKALLDPDKYMSLINDGMTQNTTRLPRIKRKSKKWEKQPGAAAGPHYATHAMGTLTAGRDQYIPSNTKMFSNRSISIVRKALSICSSSNNSS